MTSLPIAFVVHGAAAIVLILVILVLFGLGVVSFLRLTARGAKKLASSASADEERSR